MLTENTDARGECQHWLTHGWPTGFSEWSKRDFFLAAQIDEQIATGSLVTCTKAVAFKVKHHQKFNSIHSVKQSYYNNVSMIEASQTTSYNQSFVRGLQQAAYSVGLGYVMIFTRHNPFCL